MGGAGEIDLFRLASSVSPVVASEWNSPIPTIGFEADKGGTGKSMSAINYVYELSKYFRVGFVDADIDSPNIPELLGLKGPLRIRKDRLYEPIERDGIQFVSAGLFTDRVFSTTMGGKGVQQVVAGMIRGTNWTDRQIIVIDCPAGSSDEFTAVLESVGQQNLLGFFATVTPVNQADLHRVYNLGLFNEHRILGVIENMKGVLSKHGAKVICSCGCGEEFDLFAVPPGVKTVKEFCAENDLIYLGPIPMCEGYPTRALLKQPFLPDRAKDTIRKAVKMTIDLMEIRKKGDAKICEYLVAALKGGVKA